MVKKIDSRIIKNKDNGIILIDEIVTNIQADHKFKWNKENTIFSGTLKGGGVVTVEFPNNFDGDFKISFDKKGLDWFTPIETRVNTVITEKEIKDSVFHKASLEHIKSGDGMKLGDNLVLLKELDSYFKFIGFKSVIINSNIMANDNDAVANEPTLLFSQQNFSSKDDYEPAFKLWVSKFKGHTGYREPFIGKSVPTTIMSERVTEIKDGKTIFGKYFVDRNIVCFYFNPFYRIDLTKTIEIKDNKYLDEALQYLASLLMEAKIKTVKSDIGLKILISDFNKESKKHLTDMKSRLENQTRNIRDWETSLVSGYQEITALHKQIQELSVLDNTEIKTFMDEIKNVKKQEIIESVELKDSSVYITFKPATIKACLNRSLTGDAKKGPLFEAYVGRITVRIQGDGKLSAVCDQPCTKGSTANHPHINNDKHLCLGSDSEGKLTIHKLLGQRKLTDFSYMMWMFIKTWRFNSDHYASPPVYIDDRLCKGLPVFNQTGQRVVINDPVLIKAGVMKKLTKEPCYDENIKLFKDFKPQ